MLALLALQMAAYVKEAEMIGLPDIPPLFESPDAVRSSGERFYGFYDEGVAGAEELVGAVSLLDRGPDRLEIRRLMVRPERFRQGVASALLRFVRELAGGRTLSVRTVTANTAALALYGRFGFRPVWEEPTVLGLTLVELPRAAHRPD
ncbi:GNAT family N-acetyltransferase [Gorillibacterium sp. sgz5001074]|uniref:GNAT family N-acetyltransferase n=1 Tax=Gorillibacterium sp. sgz5001074 TaxID=3446695 RepID=UPI003F67C67E